MLSGKPVEGLLPPINQSISTERDSRCSANIITESLGENCCPDCFNKIWQMERKEEDLNMNASQDSLVFPAPTSGAFFFAEYNVTLNRVWRSASPCRRFQNERGNYLDLCHLLNIVGEADSGWSNLPVKTVVISAWQRLRFSVSVQNRPFIRWQNPDTLAFWDSCGPKCDECYSLWGCGGCAFVTQVQERTCDSVQNTATNVCMGSVFHSHIKAYQVSKRIGIY